MNFNLQKVFIIFKLLFCGLVICGIFSEVSDDLTYRGSPESYVVGIIENWNNENPGINDVIIFSEGENDLLEGVVKKIAASNPVTRPSIQQCTKLIQREATFLIFFSGIVNNVSNIFVFGF